MTDTLALSVAELSKTFPGTRALDRVGLEIRQGEVHALMGQNGSGKSTLIKILAGFHRPDPGAVAEVRGADFRLGDAHAAQSVGLRFVHQDLGLVSALSAVDNLALGFGYVTGRGGRIRGRTQQARTERAIEALGYDIDVQRPVEQLTVSDRTAVAIARALQDLERNVPLLVLDEPTAAMPLPEIERFLAIVRRVANRGTAVLYVSHHLGEVFELADRATVLRDGVCVGTLDIADTTKQRVVECMTGEALTRHVPRPSDDAQGAPVLQARALAGEALRHLDLDLAAGEVVGIAGISGSGRDEVCDLLFGSRPRRGDVRIHGVALESARPRLSVARAIGLVPANRHRDGVILPFSVRENITLPDLSKFWRRLILGKRAEVTETKTWIRTLQVKTSSTETSLDSLSGGNQQKVVIGKWLRINPKVLLLDEPTQGVDVAATAEIHNLIASVAKGGTAVLVCSSDEEELAILCTRVFVLRSGKVEAVLTGERVTPPAIIAESLGIDDHTAQDALAQDLVEPVLTQGDINT